MEQKDPQTGGRPTAAPADGEQPVFRHRLPIQIRFNDVDRYGHVNNNAYFAYYDLGKEDYLTHVLQVDYRSKDVVPVIASIHADFLAPIFYGDPVVVETRVAHVGQKSFTLQQRAVNGQTGALLCECATVMVCFSLREQASAPVPDEYRAAVARFEGGFPAENP